MKGRRHDEWERTSWVIAAVRNSFGGGSVLPDDCNPMLTPARRRKPKTSIKDPRLLALEEGTQVYVVK